MSTQTGRNSVPSPELHPERERNQKIFFFSSNPGYGGCINQQLAFAALCRLDYIVQHVTINPNSLVKFIRYILTT